MKCRMASNVVRRVLTCEANYPTINPKVREASLSGDCGYSRLVRSSDTRWTENLTRSEVNVARLRPWWSYECGYISLFRSSDARLTENLTGSEAAVAEAAFLVVGGRPWLQACSVSRTQSGCGRMTSVSPKGRDDTYKSNVAPAILTGTLALSSPVDRLESLSHRRWRSGYYLVDSTR